MDTIQLLGSTLGIGLVAGIRLYATVLALGLAIRFDWLHLLPGQEHLRLLSEPAVLIIAGVAYILEFVADKIPWVDSFWDSFHTFIRPVGAAVLGATVLGDIDPVVKIIIVILCGGVALSSHSTKAAARLAVNHSPEPFSNIGISVIEDLFAPWGVWLSVKHPVIAFTAVLVFLTAFAWFCPKIFRLMRLQVVALESWLKRGNQARLHSGEEPSPLSTLFNPEAAPALGVFLSLAQAIPKEHARKILGSAKRDSQPVGIRCAATKNIKGLRNSIGYLTVSDDELVFVTRRLFRYCEYRMKIQEIEFAEWKRGLLMNRFVLRTAIGESVFYTFKNLDISHRVSREPSGR